MTFPHLFCWADKKRCLLGRCRRREWTQSVSSKRGSCRHRFRGCHWLKGKSNRTPSCFLLPIKILRGFHLHFSNQSHEQEVSIGCFNTINGSKWSSMTWMMQGGTPMTSETPKSETVGKRKKTATKSKNTEPLLGERWSQLQRTMGLQLRAMAVAVKILVAASFSWLFYHRFWFRGIRFLVSNCKLTLDFGDFPASAENDINPTRGPPPVLFVCSPPAR